MLVLLTAYLGATTKGFDPDIIYLWVGLMDFIIVGTIYDVFTKK